MTLENQVCSLELAKRLKELGVKQRSVFWWCDPSDGDKADIGFIRDNHVGYKVYFSAFTVAELAAILPYKIMLGEEKCYLMIEKDQNNDNDGGDHWRVLYEILMGEQRCSEADDSLADALAAMLIHLLENKLITL